MDDIPFEVIQAQAAETPLVYVLATSHGGLALVVTKNEVRSIPLESLTKEKLQERVIGKEGEDSYLRSYLGRSADLAEATKIDNSLVVGRGHGANSIRPGFTKRRHSHSNRLTLTFALACRLATPPSK